MPKKMKRPRVRWVLNRMLRLYLNERKRSRLDHLLDHQTRNCVTFLASSIYLMMRLRLTS